MTNPRAHEQELRRTMEESALRLERVDSLLAALVDRVLSPSDRRGGVGTVVMAARGELVAFRLDAEALSRAIDTVCDRLEVAQQQAIDCDAIRQRLAAAEAALGPFASGGEWGAWLAWLVGGAPTREVGSAASRAIVGFQIAVDNALTLARPR